MEHLDEGEDFTALCDIDAIGASCSKTFSLPEGKLLSYFGIVPSGHALDLPNAALGSVFYAQLLVLRQPIRLFVCAAMMTSIFLAYQLTFVLGDLCILCWSTHIINSILFYKIVLSTLWGSDGAAKKKTI
ncbi:hypothetical protein FisN_4Hh240 [Fistulifera solaris]|uniref:vitamin-K-epoxide reductase (warfarin-sensitive) n=1 Tax=Fistulifera solaris TaxID=1519565 RepID=A0A1Z5KF14_FISSO|nr:hypothetical protein FisN_4Hh240 [Fistulifera solaris]|eukprot:GAX24682.1 hypothetical protein FisN_4Hh240 [Fistulifera solaris]